jgi:hypothetical protein
MKCGCCGEKCSESSRASFSCTCPGWNAQWKIGMDIQTLQDELKGKKKNKKELIKEIAELKIEYNKHYRPSND